MNEIELMHKRSFPQFFRGFENYIEEFENFVTSTFTVGGLSFSFVHINEWREYTKQDFYKDYQRIYPGHHLRDLKHIM